MTGSFRPLPPLPWPDPAPALDPETLRTRSTLRPGQPGTKRLVEQFGERLLCVRYRYDVRLRLVVKTVELILERRRFTPRPRRPRQSQRSQRPRRPAFALLRLDTHARSYGEDSSRLRAAGGVWRRELDAWRLPWRSAVALGFVTRGLVLARMGSDGTIWDGSRLGGDGTRPAPPTPAMAVRTGESGR